MAAAVKQGPAAGGRNRRATLLVGVAALVAVGAALAWPRCQRARRIHAALLPVPAATPSVEFSHQLSAADRQARSWFPTLAEVANLGTLYHANGFIREAEACWRLLEQEQPTVARWSYLRSDLQRRAGEYPAMAESLQRTMRLDPSYAPAWLKLADYRFKTGAIEVAATAYARRLALVPGDAYARLGQARIALQQRRPEDARSLLLAIIRDEPRFASARNLYAELLAAAGDTDGARLQRWLGREAGRYREPGDPWLDEIQSHCLDPEALQLLATVNFQTGQPREARRLMERALELRPDTVRFEALGDLLLKLGDPAAARVALERGLAAAGNSSPAIPLFVYLSQSCRQLHLPEDALQAARQGLVQHPEAFELHNAAGLALVDLNRPAEAFASFQSAVALSPQDAECNFNLATGYLQQERYDDARACLRRSLTLQPTFPKALKLLAKLELAAERPDAATEFLLPLYDAQMGDPQVRDLMVEWHLLAGRQADARKVLLEAREVTRTLGNSAEGARVEEMLRQLP